MTGVPPAVGHSDLGPRGEVAIERVIKPLLGIALAMVYFTALAWLVGRVGDSYRHNLMTQRRVASTQVLDTSTLALPNTTANDIPTKVSEQSGAGPIASPITPAMVADPPVAAVASVAKEQSQIALPPLARASSVLDTRPPILRGLTPESLRETGDELYKAIVSTHVVADDPSAVNRLERLAGALVDSGAIGGKIPTFHVLDSGAVNAFSHAGDHIYVSRGIFALAQIDAEFQFVIAHELAHQRLGHAAARVEQIAQGPRAEIGVAPWLYHLIALGYSDEQEFAADAWAYHTLQRAGRSRREALGFLRRYGIYAEEHDLSLGHRPPKSQPGEARQDLHNHYPAHPPVKERLARLAAEP